MTNKVPADIITGLSKANRDLNNNLSIVRLQNEGLMDDRGVLIYAATVEPRMYVKAYKAWLKTSESYKEAIRSLAGVKNV